MKDKTRLKKLQKEQRQRNQNNTKVVTKNKSGSGKTYVSIDSALEHKKAVKKRVVTGIAIFLSALLCFVAIVGVAYFLYDKTSQKDKLFKNGVIAVKKDNKWGYINPSGKVVLDFYYDSAFNFTDNKLALVGKNGKFGYINKKGNYVIAPVYESAFSFDGDVAIVCKNGKFGAINSKGETVIDFSYTKIGGDKGKFVGGYTSMVKNGKYGIVSKSGNVIIEPTYENITDVNGTYFTYMIGTKVYISRIDKTNPDDFYTKEFQEASLIGINYCIYGKNGLYGLLGKDGIVFEPKYSKLKYSSGDYLQYSTDGDFYGYLDFNGNVVLESKFLTVSDELNDYAIVKYSGDELFYCIERNGEKRFSLKCDKLGSFHNSRATFYNKSSSRYGVVNTNGKVLCDAIYKYISKFYDDNYAIVQDTNGHYGVIKSSCRVIIKPIYDNVCIG